MGNQNQQRENEQSERRPGQHPDDDRESQRGDQGKGRRDSDQGTPGGGRRQDFDRERMEEDARVERDRDRNRPHQPGGGRGN